MRAAIALAGAALVAVLAVWLLVLRGPGAPADNAIALVPPDALLYAHLSTDASRDEDAELLDTLAEFPALAQLRPRLERLVSPREGAFDLERDVRSWLGDEAGLALIDSGGPAAEVLLLLAVRDEPKAQALLARAAGAAGGVEHRGIAVRRFGGVSVAFVAGFMAIGQETAVKAAIDRARGGPSLTRIGELPDERSLDVWLSPDGVRRVLRPQGGLVAALGGLLDSPDLRGVSISLAAEDDGLRAHVRLGRRKAPPVRTFEPELIDSVPGDSAAYVGISGLQSLLPLLPALTNVDLAAALDTLHGEVAFSAAPALPVPVLTLVTRTRDEAATREDLGRLFGEIAELIGGDSRDVVPSIETRRIAGVETSSLVLGPEAELLAAVFDGRVVISTSASAVERAAEGGDSLRDSDRFDRAVGDLPEQVEALTFFDLAQLLTLGEQAGLSSNPALDTVRDDLRRIRSVGAVAEREGTDTTAELFFEIP